MALKFPRFIALQSNECLDEFLSFVHGEQPELEGYLKFKEIEVLSPYANFQVEPATGEGKEDYVHIKSTQNHRYLVGTHSNTNTLGWQYCITATSQRKDEDVSKETCTLYQFLPVDAATKTYRIKHVKSGCYLCLCVSSRKHVVLEKETIFIGRNLYVYRVIDLEPLTLPKYAAFRVHDLYLCPRQIKNQPYLQFAANNIGDPTTAFEIFDEKDGNISIKSVSSGKFWSLIDRKWILADSDTRDALFRPIKIDDRKIALINVANGKFAKLFTKEVVNGLNARISYIDEFSEIQVTDLIKKREIHDVKYDLDYAIFPEQREVVVATSYAINSSQNALTFNLKLIYQDIKTSSWDANLSIKSGVKASFINIELPFIFKDNCLELSDKFQQDLEWGETKTSSTGVEVVYKVVVPPKTKVTVDLLASYAKYEVPYSITQKETLNNGSIVTTKVERASYTGSNYYNFNFKTKEEKQN